MGHKKLAVRCAIGMPIADHNVSKRNADTIRQASEMKIMTVW